VEIGRADEACLRAHAELAYPRECCGLVLADLEAGILRVRQVMPTPNGATDRRRFRIHPCRVLKTMIRARQLGWSLAGVYHSHPEGQARPSTPDRLDSWDELVQLIVRCDGGVARSPRAWLLHGVDSGAPPLEIPVGVAADRPVAS